MPTSKKMISDWNMKCSANLLSAYRKPTIWWLKKLVLFFKLGRTTIDINLRYQEDQNLFMIQTALNPLEQFNEQVLEEVFNIENVFAKLQDNLAQNGIFF
jgi:hypothetical protein